MIVPDAARAISRGSMAARVAAVIPPWRRQVCPHSPRRICAADGLPRPALLRPTRPRSLCLSDSRRSPPPATMARRLYARRCGERSTSLWVFMTSIEILVLAEQTCQNPRSNPQFMSSIPREDTDRTFGKVLDLLRESSIACHQPTTRLGLATSAGDAQSERRGAARAPPTELSRRRLPTAPLEGLEGTDRGGLGAGGEVALVALTAGCRRLSRSGEIRRILVHVAGRGALGPDPGVRFERPRHRHRGTWAEAPAPRAARALRSASSSGECRYDRHT
jgi:hypothetical protein